MTNHTILFLAANPVGTDRLAIDTIDARGRRWDLRARDHQPHCSQAVPTWQVVSYPRIMSGSVSVPKISGARSEVLAEYVFARGGPVLRGRDDSDYGVDLFCSLASPIGKRMLLRSHYTVQVKSARDAWSFKDREAIEWFVAHPSPLFLAIVDKKLGTIDVFQTFARFDLFVHARYPVPLMLHPGKPGTGSVGLWDGVKNDYDLGAPVIRVTANELFDDEVLDARLNVLSAWIEIERKNILLRDLGLLRFRGPGGYETNMASFRGYNEKGLGQVTDEQFEAALHALGESLDCVGSQHGYTRRAKDPETLLLMMLLMRRITDSGRKNLSIHDGISVAGLKRWIQQSDDRYVGESVDRVIQSLLNDHTTIELLERIRAG